jgi:hypothetical protein
MINVAPGVIADVAGLSWAIGAMAALTFLSGLVAALLMRSQPATNLAAACSTSKPVGQNES